MTKDHDARNQRLYKATGVPLNRIKIAVDWWFVHTNYSIPEIYNVLEIQIARGKL